MNTKSIALINAAHQNLRTVGEALEAAKKRAEEETSAMFDAAKMLRRDAAVAFKVKDKARGKQLMETAANTERFMVEKQDGVIRPALEAYRAALLEAVNYETKK